MDIESTWLANLRVLVASEGGGRVGYRSVSEAAGLSEEYIYQLCEGKPKKDGAPRQVGKRAAKKIATAFANGRSDGWFDLPLIHGGSDSPARRVAQSLSHHPTTMQIPDLKWEQVMVQKHLPQEFRTQLPDDSCSPNFPKGHWIVWNTDRSPSPGKLILACDQWGQLHARVYQLSGAPGSWIATPMNPGYAPFEGATLTVVASYRGHLEP